ncbi:MAG: MBOAT family protein [Planctomycetota bacterium]|nr:MBOAT family protein [Planctomycetota bacterium]
MLFNSFTFWIFFAAVFAAYAVLAHRWQNRLLLAASYVFYGWWDWRFLSLMAFSTLVDYVAGLRIAQSDEPRRRRNWLLLSVVTNLGLLGFFKYCGFFVRSAADALTALGLEPNLPALSIVLPVGISFYTFQTLSYSIDIYRRELEPSRDLLDFALFVSFFPQLVAGPIERARNLLPQIQQPRRMTWDGWCEGATLCAIGLFKKVAVADLVAPMVARAFAAPEACTGTTLLVGLYAFSLQIYADFSGYSDMARGLARIMGFNLMENFQQPYFSASITEFWRRWHISLSTWLRDYLYIPLGGNRGDPAAAYRNLLVTMTLGGLWHGANWTFVVWGVLHGLYLAVHKRILGGARPLDVPAKDTPARFAVYLVKLLATFHLVALTWIFFRAQDFSQAFAYLGGILSWSPGAAEGPIRFDADEIHLMLAAVLSLLALVDIPQYWKRSHTALLRWSYLPRVVSLTVLLIWLILSRREANAPFIYFQF